MMKKLLIMVALGLVSWTGLNAQGVTTASINGLVTDKNGEPLPGATVLAVHVPSGTKYGSTSRKDGRYNVPGVRVGGPYTITVSFVGYEDQKDEVDYLALDQNYTANFKLGESVTQLSEIQVTALKDPVLNSDRTGAATSVRREQFERLPTITRSFQDFTQLDPRAGIGSNAFSFGGRSYLYNNFTIDGATSNNVFGLNSLPGGQTNSQPVAVDAIQAAQVNFAPYDVRQGAFTGAGVNVVTRSGTNEFTGSVYGFYKNQGMVGTKVGGVTQTNANFTYNNYGARLGGPIIKDKLFFFVNYEFEKNISPAVTYPANGAGNVTTAITDKTNPAYGSETNLQRIVDFFNDPANASITGGYKPGTYNNFDLPTQSTKYLARLDWNISEKHKLTLRYNQLNAFRDVIPSTSFNPFTNTISGARTVGINSIPFSNSYYRQLNNLYAVVAELNSSFNSKFSNTLTLGYSAFRDPREQGGGGAVPAFPIVDIKNPGTGLYLTSIGPDPFTKNNKLYQDIIQINDNFNIYLPNHVVSIGTANELFKFTNTFTAMINGNYQYNSISDFLNNMTAPTAANAPTVFQVQYSAQANNPAPGAIWKAQQFGLYAQDEYTGFKNLKLTYGMRVDMPSYPSTLPQNPTSDGMTFANGEKNQVGKLPKASILYSPRIGFNWDVKGDKTLQIRGGTGVFTGRIPFVWLSNQVTNNGLLFGQIAVTGQANTFSQGFNFNHVPVTSTGAAPQFGINGTVPNFKFPQVWRTNFAVDKSLPGGLVATVEAIYTKDINAIFWRDANLSAPIKTVDGDGRPQFASTIAPNPTTSFDGNGVPLYGRRINQNMVNAYILDNTNKGYSLSLTGQLQKTFSKQFYASAGYTYTDARDVNAGTGSQASTTAYATVLSFNTPIAGYSSNLQMHRVVASASYRKEYGKYFATTLSGIYQGSSGNRFSYTYSGDVNNDGSSSNDLIYIPRNQSEILLTTSSASDTRSTSQIWQQLDNYIAQDSYLSKHRGQYAARNGAVAPWFNLLNVRLLQDFYVETGNKKRNTIQLSVECVNFLNLLNSNWGIVRNPARSALLSLAGFENPAATTANTQTNPLLPNNSYTTTATTGRPIFTFATNPDGSALSNSWINNTTSLSRYQLQVGLRYIFN